MRSPLIGMALFLFVASSVCAQQKPKSHEQCLKQAPGDWGPNFGDKWHQNEAVYWACRNGVSAETIKAWQQAAEEQDMATEIKPVTVTGQKLVLFVEDGGTANCYGLTVLRQVGTTWIKAWELPSRKGDEEGYYCAGNCPGLEAATTGDILTVRSASSSDPNDNHCKHVRWETERFRWNGSTFLPAQ
jgi:hypothetical protein